MELAKSTTNTPYAMNKMFFDKKLDPGIPRVDFSYVFPPGSKI